MLRVITLALAVGVLPFLYRADAYADEPAVQAAAAQQATEESKETNRWLDDYRQPVGFTYGAEAVLQTAYLFRGVYVGGANIQASANVGYGGLYAGLWWNIGVTDWTFRTFEPEVDVTIGFARWGMDVNLLYVHNFDCAFFDFTNYPSGGNSLELRASYTVSSKLPLRFLWATRVAASDGYVNDAGDTVRAWSSYAELSYTHRFAYGLSLHGAFGITPWKSRYTGFQRGFAFQLVELRLRKDWSVSEHCGLMLQGQLCINPSLLATDKASAQWHPADPWNQSINANIGFGVYLK